jgi:hypothetical protein
LASYAFTRESELANLLKGGEMTAERSVAVVKKAIQAVNDDTMGQMGIIDIPGK